MQDVGFAVAGDEVEGSGDADGFLVEVDAENSERVILVLFRNGGIGEQAAGDLENGMHGKTATAGGRVDHVFAGLRMEHFDAHINDVAGCKVLPFFAFGGFADQIFKGFVNDEEVGVEQLDVLQAGNANGQMAVGEFKSRAFGKHTRPFVYRARKKGLDSGLDLCVSLAGSCSKLHVAEISIVNLG